MGERVFAGSQGGALLANALATAAGLFVLVTSLAPISGAHFNPLVSLWIGWRDRLPRARIAAFIAVQVVGAVAGVMAAHAMFGLPLVQSSQHARDSAGERFSEVIATFGLVTVIGLSRGYSTPVVAALVGSYIGAAYWFTASTSFANPAVTLARSLTDTFSGIAPSSVAAFVLAQAAGCLVAIALLRFIAAERDT
jgi:glycerol uptake facilitator-like aquaporin